MGVNAPLLCDSNEPNQTLILQVDELQLLFTLGVCCSWSLCHNSGFGCSIAMRQSALAFYRICASNEPKIAPNLEVVDEQLPYLAGTMHPAEIGQHLLVNWSYSYKANCVELLSNARFR